MWRPAFVFRKLSMSKRIVAWIIVLGAAAAAIGLVWKMNQTDATEREYAGKPQFSKKFRLVCAECDAETLMTGDEFVSKMKLLKSGEKLVCPKCNKAALNKVNSPMELGPPLPEDAARALDSRKEGAFQSPKGKSKKKPAKPSAATRPAKDSAGE